MKYQLVVQFEADSLRAFDDLVAFEEILRAHRLPFPDAFVDGHDFGAGTFNLFIHTDAPRETLEEVGKAIEQARPGLSFSSGYRAFGEDEYTALWPPGSERFVIA